MKVRMNTTSAYVAIVSAVRERRASGYANPSRSASERPPVTARSARLTRSCWKETNVTAAAVRTTPWTTYSITLAPFVESGTRPKIEAPQTTARNARADCTVRGGKKRPRMGARPTSTKTGPSRRPKPSSDGAACRVVSAPRPTARHPATSQMRRCLTAGGSGMSRIARMMFRRLTRTLVPTIVASATANATANELARLARLEREEELEAVVLRREDPRRHGDEHPAEADADDDAERRGRHGVEPPLQGEGPHEVGPAHADGACHTELGLALGREHHEQVDKQQEPGDDAEAAHRGEHRAERLAGRVSRVEHGALDFVDLRLERRSRGRGADLRDRSVGAADPALDAAAVRDGDHPGRRLPRARRRRDPVEGAGCYEHVARLLLCSEPEARDATPRQDAVDHEDGAVAVGVDRDAAARADPERPPEVARDRAVPGWRRRAGDPGRRRVVPEAARGLEVETDELRPGRREDVRAGRGSRDVQRREGEEPVDVPPHDRLQRGQELPLVGGPTCGDQLVDRAEIGAADLANRGVHGVPDDRRAGDDRGAEQRAEHDERGLPGAPDGVAHREPAQHGPSCQDQDERQGEGEHGEDGERRHRTDTASCAYAGPPSSSSATSSPSRTVIRRSARAATLGS